jgi:phage terminase large subunit-like protein
MADFNRYANDIVAFAEHEFAYPGERGPELIVLQPYQRQLLRYLFTPNASQRFPFETIVLSQPKKSGKTALAALVALWTALRGHKEEIILCANDLD